MTEKGLEFLILYLRNIKKTESTGGWVPIRNRLGISKICPELKDREYGECSSCPLSIAGDTCVPNSSYSKVASKVDELLEKYLPETKVTWL